MSEQISLSLPDFSSIKIDKIEQQLTEMLALHLNKITELLKQPEFTWQNLMYNLTILGDELGKFWGPINHLQSVCSSDELRKVYQACIPKLSDFSTKLGHNIVLFNAIETLSKGNAFAEYELAQKKIIADELLDFKLSGVNLDAEKKQQFKKIEQSLSEICNRFAENVMDTTDAWQLHITDEKRLLGMPQHAIDAALHRAEQKDLSGWLLSLDFPCYFAVITYAHDRELRQELYTAFSTRASDQGPHDKRYDNDKIMQEILLQRHALAKLVGYNNYAEYSLAKKMANTTAEVMAFLNDLADKTHAFAVRDWQTLTDFAKQQGAAELAAWDVAYYSEKLRHEKYDISQETLRPYFPEDKVFQGMFALVGKLYGLNFVEVDAENVWHDDVRCFKIVGENGQVDGFLYSDLYAREKKRGGAWMDEYATRFKLADGSVQVPVAFLTCNFSAPTGDKPSLLTHEDVITLFHEFGHCLHHLLSQVDYLEVSGINGVAWDAVELPSQFMEFFCWEKPVLDMISGHHETGETIPNELYEKMLAAKNFQSGMQAVRQLEFAIFDFRMHAEFQPGKEKEIQVLLNEVRAQVGVVPTPIFNRFQNGFSHIFAGGYAAGYYSYRWAEVLAADAYDLFAENGVISEEIGHQFLTKILEKGGSQEAMDLFVAFRGRKPDVAALLRYSGLVFNH